MPWRGEFLYYEYSPGSDSNEQAEYSEEIDSVMFQKDGMIVHADADLRPSDFDGLVLRFHSREGDTDYNYEVMLDRFLEGIFKGHGYSTIEGSATSDRDIASLECEVMVDAKAGEITLRGGKWEYLEGEYRGDRWPWRAELFWTTGISAVIASPGGCDATYTQRVCQDCWAALQAHFLFGRKV
jgi:hypothetical protein